MARINEILTGRHNRFIQKLFGMKGPPPAPQLSSEIGVFHPISHGVENRYLESWDRFGLQGNVGAVAAQNDAFQLRNPAGSNVVCVVEKVTTTITVADEMFMDVVIPPATDLTTLNVTTHSRFDNRGRDAPTIQFSQQNNAAAGSVTQLRATHLVLTSFDWILFEEQELTILPGDALRWRTAGNNEGLRFAIIIRERFLEEGERV